MSHSRFPPPCPDSRSLRVLPGMQVIASAHLVCSIVIIVKTARVPSTITGWQGQPDSTPDDRT